MNRLRIALAQINTTVGDIEGNKNLILNSLHLAQKMGADCVAFPELTITGYPPEDLLLKSRFVQNNLDCLSDIAKETEGITAVVGFVDEGASANSALYNAAAVLHNGKHVSTFHKICLPNYGVFDEKRYFTPGNDVPLFELKGISLGVNVCEDIWEMDVTQFQAQNGARVIINLSSSPYHAGKGKERESIITERAKENGVIVAYVNLAGGQDELVFDGHSLICDSDGKILAHGKQFDEDFLLYDLKLENVRGRGESAPRTPNSEFRWQSKLIKLKVDPESRRNLPPIPPSNVKNLDPIEEIYQALVLGTRDYVKKNSFQKVVLGISGGIDSSLTAAVAVDALKKDNVIGVYMPSPYSSRESEEDWKELVKKLGIESYCIPIEDTFLSYRKMMSDTFKGTEEDITEENLQARIRGNILMALSNKFGWLVLTTGNKSEISVGYCTLYGDTAGGFSVLKDVPKTLVYQLATYRNSIDQEIIPERVLMKPPTAELKPNQKDEDSLPPYEILDPILEAYVEKDKEVEEIVPISLEELYRWLTRMNTSAARRHLE
jgi:NAD+ synthase (glutamine-hydrolysing)